MKLVVPSQDFLTRATIKNRSSEPMKNEISSTKNHFHPQKVSSDETLHWEPQLIGSPLLATSRPLTKKVGDPATVNPSWQLLPQQWTIQRSVLLCIPLELAKTSFDAEIFLLGGKHP